MKKMLFVLLVSSMFFACGSDSELKDPNIVAENFLKEYIGLNYESAKKYATPEFLGILEQYQAEKALLSAEVIKESESATVEIKNLEIQDAEGVAYAKFTHSQVPDIVDQLELRKKDDKWYVNNVERTVDVELDDKFPQEEIDKMMEEAEAQDEIIPLEEVE